MGEGQRQPHEASLLAPSPQHGIHVQQGNCSVLQEGRSQGDRQSVALSPSPWSRASHLIGRDRQSVAGKQG